MARRVRRLQAYHLDAAQVLLTGAATIARMRGRGVRPGVVPTQRERRGDHPRAAFRRQRRLAALIAQMIKADALVLLTDVDGSGTLLRIIRVRSSNASPARTTFMSVLVTGAGSRWHGRHGDEGAGRDAGDGQRHRRAWPAQTTQSWKRRRVAPGSNRRPSVQPSSPDRTRGTSAARSLADEGAAQAITVGKQLVAGVPPVLGHFEAGDARTLPVTGTHSRGVSGYDSIPGQTAGAGGDGWWRDTSIQASNSPRRPAGGVRRRIFCAER